jgi:hypothetical protein
MLTQARLPRARRGIVTLHVAMEWAIHAPGALRRLRAFVTDNDGHHSFLCSAKGSKLARE